MCLMVTNQFDDIKENFRLFQQVMKLSNKKLIEFNKIIEFDYKKPQSDKKTQQRSQIS